MATGEYYPTPVFNAPASAAKMDAHLTGIVADNKIEANMLAASGAARGSILVADGAGGVEFNPMSTFEYNHKDLSDSLSGKEESELIDIIRRHRKIVEQIDDMMIDLLAGAEICSKVIMECLNNTKVKAIQLINYALCTLMDDMESVDRIETKEAREHEFMKQLLGVPAVTIPATIAVPANTPVNVPLFQTAPLVPSVTNVSAPSTSVTNTTGADKFRSVTGKMMGLNVVDSSSGD